MADARRRAAARRRRPASPGFRATASAAARAFGVPAGTSMMIAAGRLRAARSARRPDHVGALRGGQAAAPVADEDDDRAVGLLDRDRMALAIIVREAARSSPRRRACRRPSATAAPSSATARRRRALRSAGNCGCHRSCPRPASVRDEAVGAAIDSGAGSTRPGTP